jgi:hypothetical protein
MVKGEEIHCTKYNKYFLFTNGKNTPCRRLYECLMLLIDARSNTNNFIRSKGIASTMPDAALNFNGKIKNVWTLKNV